MTRHLFLLLAATTSLLTGCDGDPTFTPVTNAPPGATADLHSNRSNNTHAIHITEGVAMAVECEDQKHRPCSFDGTTIEDSSIATFKRAYADLDQKEVYSRGVQQKSNLTRTVFVVAGKKPGTTKMTVRTGYGDVPITIEVLAR